MSDNENAQEKKCVLVIDENLPVGVIANTSAVLALSLGKLIPEMIGNDFQDIDGKTRRGITTYPIPALKGNGELLRSMREKLKDYESDLIVIDLLDATRTTRSYEEYIHVVQNTPEQKQEYLGIAISGSKKLVNKFTGNLGLLR
jgi:hypothetical protein